MSLSLMEVSHVLVGGFTYPDQGAFTLDLMVYMGQLITILQHFIAHLS